MDSFEVDTVIAGAGVVGLAVARALSMAGREVLVLEKNPVFGEETSARNSEVIHAGIYYDPGSLKARHCVAGRSLLYQFCAEHGVAHRNCGKLIVAADDLDLEKLPAIAARAAENGVTLTPIDGAEARRREPALAAVGALESPTTGIVDSHGFMLALIGVAEAHGAQIVTRAEILRGSSCAKGGVELAIGGAEPMRLTARTFINAAGLWAPALAKRIDGAPTPPDLTLVKGNYFALSGRAPFSRLIYPVPSDGGLGVHLTLDMGGRAKFGPDTEWLGHGDPTRIDYAVNDGRRGAFARAIRRYWPNIAAERLIPDYSGVRPKLDGGNYPDFRIDGPRQHGQAGQIHLYGIESPGMTAALSIAQSIAENAV